MSQNRVFTATVTNCQCANAMGGSLSRQRSKHVLPSPSRLLPLVGGRIPCLNPGSRSNSMTGPGSTAWDASSISATVCSAASPANQTPDRRTNRGRMTTLRMRNERNTMRTAFHPVGRARSRARAPRESRFAFSGDSNGKKQLAHIADLPTQGLGLPSRHGMGDLAEGSPLGATLLLAGETWRKSRNLFRMSTRGYRNRQDSPEQPLGLRQSSSPRVRLTGASCRAASSTRQAAPQREPSASSLWLFHNRIGHTSTRHLRTWRAPYPHRNAMMLPIEPSTFSQRTDRISQPSRSQRAASQAW